MSLICPTCESPSLKVIDSVECGPSGAADEETVQRAYCGVCDTCFLCRYQEVRSFRPDRDDRVSHVAFVADRRDWIVAGRAFWPKDRRVAWEGRIVVANYHLARARAGGHGAPIRLAKASGGEPDPPSHPEVAELSILTRIWFWCARAYLREPRR